MKVEEDAAGRSINGARKMLFKLCPQHVRTRRCDAGLLHHFIIGDLKHLGCIYLHKVVERILHSRDAHPMAAGGKAAACKRFVIAKAHEAVDKAVIAGKSRPAVFILEKIPHAFAEEVLIHIVMHAHSEVAGNIYPVRCFKDKVADMTCHVAPFVVRSGKLVIAGIIEEKAGNIELCRFVVDYTGGNIMLIERAQQLVQLSAGWAAVVKSAEKAEPAHPLDALTQGLRPAGGNFLVADGHFREVVFKVGVLLLLCKPGYLPRHTVQKSNDMLHHHDLAFIKLLMLCAGIYGLIFFQLFEDTAPAQIKSDAQVGRKMSVRADAADDVILVKGVLQFRIRYVWIPDSALLARHEEEASADKGVQRVAVERVLIQHLAVICAPALISVKAAVIIIGDGIKMEIIRRNNAAIIVLIQTALKLDLLLRLIHLALLEQTDALVQRKFLISGIFVYKLYFTHCIHTPCLISYRQSALTGIPAPSASALSCCIRASGRGFASLNASALPRLSYFDAPSGLKFKSS